MGTIFAPTYANMFVLGLDKNNIYPLNKDRSISYLSFIDNIFMLWTKSENQLESLINEINKTHHSIKFGFKYSKGKIKILDTLVYKNIRIVYKPHFLKSSGCKIGAYLLTKKEYSLQSSIEYAFAQRLINI